LCVQSCCGDIYAYLANCKKSINITGIDGFRYYFDYPSARPLARFIQIAPGVLGVASAYNTYGAGQEGFLWVQSQIDDARYKGILWVIVSMHKNYISMLTKSNEVFLHYYFIFVNFFLKLLSFFIFRIVLFLKCVIFFI
jgi:hypothetical protein